jgi:hypothetical protein
MSVLHCTAVCCILVARHRDRPRMEPMAVTQTYSLRLDAERRSRLEEIARRKDRDLSYVIRKAIDEYIERHQHNPDKD